ncbi:HAD hydrolase family protein [Lacticaseibacillus manihotivorans]|uniref:HAD hydrolase family protein n=1 Tax=Lacticaseibacillus manihotivorans TaxID=88233 RepID=A0A5P8JNZ6_9LACO|nr:HAD hydrolase family protein [Lacticaseibacillus manihotivorans]
MKIHDQLVDEPVSMVWASANFLEITNFGVTKLSGLKALAETWHGDVQDFVAFGDYENDLAMLEGVGCGVAMSNAIPEVKQVADAVVDNHDHAGVGRSLQALLAH